MKPCAYRASRLPGNDPPALAHIHPEPRFGVGFRDRLRGLNQIALRRGFLLESLSILRVAVVNGDATRPELARGYTVY